MNGQKEVRSPLSVGSCIDSYCVQAFYRRRALWRTQRNMYADHYSNFLVEAKEQLSGSISCFVQSWDAGKLNKLEEHWTIEERKYIILLLDWKITCVVNLLFLDCVLVSERSDLFKAFVFSEHGAVHYFDIAKLSEFFRIVIPSDQVYAWPSTSQMSNWKCLTYIVPSVG